MRVSDRFPALPSRSGAFSSTVMVGEGRPSTSFLFPDSYSELKRNTKRGWSAFADHDDQERQLRPDGGVADMDRQIEGGA